MFKKRILYRSLNFLLQAAAIMFEDFFIYVTKRFLLWREIKLTLGQADLLDFINSAEKYGQLDECSLHQVWGELCKAVGWMHSVALVRNIKLESRLFVSPTSGAATDVFLRYLIDQGLKCG